MKSRISKTFVIVYPLTILFIAGFGCSGKNLSIDDIPRYPNAVEGEFFEQSAPGGFLSGNSVQFNTEDSYDEVVTFYSDAMREYRPQILDQPSELGRQKAFTITQRKGVLTVVVQEFKRDGEVNITFMSVGR